MQTIISQPLTCQSQDRSQLISSSGGPSAPQHLGIGSSQMASWNTEEPPVTSRIDSSGHHYADSSSRQADTQVYQGDMIPRVTLTDSGTVRNTNDNTMYDIDLEQQTRRVHPQALAPHNQMQPDPSQSPTNDSTSIVRRLSQRLSKRASSLWGGEAVAMTAEDEKRLEDERRAREEEERRLDEEEKEMLKRGLFNWSEMKHWRFWIRKEWWHWYLILVICGVIAVLFTIYHDKIVDWLTPYAKDLKELPGGWAIPIGILFILSVPPLFGAEVICLLCGLVWGLWIGFGIVCAGTFLGEMGNFYLFRYTLKGYAAKLERKNMTYALMAHVIREGGFKVAMIARFSAIPGHFLTAIFSTCGMSVWAFAIGTILSLPKQLALVYLGVLIASNDQSSKDTIVSYTVLAVSVAVTLLAMWYIYKKMNEAKLPVWRARRLALEGKGVDVGVLPIEPVNEKLDTLPVSRKYAVTDEEASSPILRNASVPGTSDPSSYPNPYDDMQRPLYDKKHATRSSQESSEFGSDGRNTENIAMQRIDSSIGRLPQEPLPEIGPFPHQEQQLPRHVGSPTITFPEPSPYPHAGISRLQRDNTTTMDASIDSRAMTAHPLLAGDLKRV